MMYWTMYRSVHVHTNLLRRASTVGYLEYIHICMCVCVWGGVCVCVCVFVHGCPVTVGTNEVTRQELGT